MENNFLVQNIVWNINGDETAPGRMGLVPQFTVALQYKGEMWKLSLQQQIWSIQLSAPVSKEKYLLLFLEKIQFNTTTINILFNSTIYM